jgi:predicted kinase
LTPTLAKTLIVFCGPPCCGKTTLASEIQRETGGVYLAVDRILRKLIPNSAYGEADRDLAYRSLNLIVEHLLASGSGAIVDATFARAPHLEELQSLAREFHSRVLLVQCKTTGDLAVERFRMRGADHPATDLDEERIRYLNQTYPYSSEGMMVDTSGPLEGSLRAIRQYIGLTGPLL